VWYNAALRITDSRVVVSQPLYRPDQERDACGTGFVAGISGRPSHRTLEVVLTAVTNLGHRGALIAGARTGDGAMVIGSEETCALPRS
jgi:glutamate synthase domain-containing protein 1